MKIDLSSFAHWAAGAVLGNTLRGVLAEYIIAQALGITTTTRVEWDAVDLVTSTGLKLEVKSSAYVQDWPQTKPSVISFSMGKRHAWDARTNTTETVALRSADAYIFAVFTWQEDLHDKIAARAAVLDTDHWRFIVVSTTELDSRFNDQSTVRLSVLLAAGFQMIRFEELAEVVERVTVRSEP